MLLPLLGPASSKEPGSDACSPDNAWSGLGCGRRMSEIDDDLRIYMKSFIGEVVAKPPGRGYARWHRRVCIGVENLRTDAARYIVDRIALLALEVGLEVDESGCRPDVMVIFATDAKNVSTYMVENHLWMFRPEGLGVGAA